MNYGNVLVIGNSGVGKSTLINAVLGEDAAETGWGVTGTSRELRLYERKDGRLPFRIIDTIGFEPTPRESKRAIKAVNDWSKQCARAGRSDNLINVIWFCVDGVAAKLFPDTIEKLCKATEMWKSVPIIVVITKSFSVPDREKNIAMVKEAFAKSEDAKFRIGPISIDQLGKKRKGRDIRAIIPVVAQTYVLNDAAYAPPEGIEELIEATNDVLPDGVEAAKKDLDDYILDRKRVQAQSVVGTAVVASAGVGFAPLPVADGVVLTSIETSMVKALAKIYDIGNDEGSNQTVNALIQAGTAGAVAKGVLSAIKAIPGLAIATAPLNAMVAGSTVATLGGVTIASFEAVARGEKSTEDIDWLNQMIEGAMNDAFMSKIIGLAGQVTENMSLSDVIALLGTLLKPGDGKKKLGE